MMIELEESMKLRAQNLKTHKKLNGFDFLTVRVDEDQGFANLHVYFFNSNNIDQISREKGTREEKLYSVFPISGGIRVPAGKETGKVKIVGKKKVGDKELNLEIKPIGDYSTYILKYNGKFKSQFDPLFDQIKFKFRPGCFNTVCSKKTVKKVDFEKSPVINYLAKDYETFKHIFISSMAEKIPGWAPSSEADLDMVIIELLCSAADELSDYQDRVMNEAYLNTAKKRVTLDRYAKLMNYHIHQGNQADTWIGFKIKKTEALPTQRSFPDFNDELKQQTLCLEKNLYIGTEESNDFEDNIIFSNKIGEANRFLHYLLNDFTLYTWGNTNLLLRRGATQADLQLKRSTKNKIIYKSVTEWIKNEKTIKHFIIQNWKKKENKLITNISSKPQILSLHKKETILGYDPVTQEYYIRIFWDSKDQLKNDYYFTNNKNYLPLFHGNLVKFYHGEFKETIFISPDSNEFLKTKYSNQYIITNRGVICKLPENHLSFVNKYGSKIPNGEIPRKSTLRVYVQEKENSEKDEWLEVISFIHSDRNQKHFIVETNEHNESFVVFGNGINGRRIPKNSIITCRYQIGQGTKGNIGADKLINFKMNNPSEYLERIERCWNPFDVINGRDPESVDEIIRWISEAYKYKQLRAVTVNNEVDDYEERAQENRKVSKAHATYRWMGSWRLVLLSIDIKGKNELKPEEIRELFNEIIMDVDCVRLIGDQVVIKTAKYIPLEIHVKVCLQPDQPKIEIENQLYDEFSDDFTKDGRKAFFHPDEWTFGQVLHKSKLIGRIHEIEGIELVKDTPSNPLVIKKCLSRDPGYYITEFLVEPDEIIQVCNDPMQLEKGFIEFEVIGGL